MKVAIIGSGIAGLAAAHTLLKEGHGQVRPTLFEAGSYFGGHTHTVNVTLPTPHGPHTHGVDTGFLVFNERTYPKLIALFKELGVATAKSDMSFSVQAQALASPQNRAPIEWSGSSLGSVFAQRGNLVNWRFWRMLRDLVRFNALATELALLPDELQLRQPLGEFLQQHRFSQEFRDWYFLPMIACIWSCPTAQMLQFPVGTMVRFCHNHGLLQITQRPQWWTVVGGARHYVEKITARIDDKRLNTPVQSIDRTASKLDGGIRLYTEGASERFDKVIIATHSDQALAMLLRPSEHESQTLSAIRYQRNLAVLHTDESVLPARKQAWAAWNYAHLAGANTSGPDALNPQTSGVCLHYLINRLQPLPWAQSVIVSLNPTGQIAPDKVIDTFDYAHPVFDQAAVKAQRQVPWLQGQQDTYFCGAWTGYGFHEDGLKSGMAVARQLLASINEPVQVGSAQATQPVAAYPLRASMV